MTQHSGKLANAASGMGKQKHKMNEEFHKEGSVRGVNQFFPKRPKRPILICFTAFFSVLLVFSLFMVLRSGWQRSMEQQAFEELRRKVTLPAAPQQTRVDSPVSQGEDKTEAYVSPYIELYRENPDCVGWLTIANTDIDYPVMYTPQEPQFYLHRAFDRTESQSGVPFIGAGCDLDSGCVIIYGHNMKNKTMFGTLDRYEDVEFWQENPIFLLYTAQEERQYEVFAVLKTQIPSVGASEFRYYDYAGNPSEADFNDLVSGLTALSIYDTAISPGFGEQILMLSTCSYHTENGRFVVAARRIE